MSSPCVPRATYRLQLNANFGFREATEILDYLRDLGISHVYTSPVLTSRKGSGHGYDVTDPTKIDSDLGGEEALVAFQAALQERGMGLLLDIVPNHMAASSENRWWMDVLEHGPDSPFAFYFDIDWRPPLRSLENKLLLPFLERPFSQILEGGEFQLRCDNGRFLLQYGELTFPIAPGSYAEILRFGDVQAGGEQSRDSPARQEWRGIISVAEAIAADHNPGTQAAAERRSKSERTRERLRQLLATSPEIFSLLGTTLQKINGTSGNPRSFIELERILSDQYYRLAFWQTPSETINYRRFFSITDLVGVRVEDPAVFDSTHEAAIRLGYKPCLSSLRIDHIDGLRDPAGYLDRLQERLSASTNGNGKPAYLIVEKILERDESIPEEWPVAGTTGYDYLNFANRLLVDEEKADAIQGIYSRWIGSETAFDEIVYQKKKLVMRTILATEIRSLGRQLAELARDDRYARELDPAELTEALVEVTACMSVYRTYIHSLEVPETDQKVLSDAIDAARVKRSNLPSAYFDFVSDVLLLAAREHTRPDQREARLAFLTRWQQFTGPIVAKGFEDTALYVYFPLASLNEVGGDPRVTEAHPWSIHDFIEKRRLKWPHSLNATTTHDTKRSEDTRARIAVLSEIPNEWEAALGEWSRMNEPLARDVNGGTVPDRNEQYFFYQTLVGAWPLCEQEWPAFVQRIQEYVLKATREAMVHTRWTRPNESHEAALRDFVSRVLDRERSAEFCASFQQFQERTALYGMLNGLGQTVLRVMSPGVPDCYQGSELWDLRLVDPDNRGLIDFAARRSVLAGLRNAPKRECPQHSRELLSRWRDGRIKVHVLTEALAARREHPELFLDGDYRPLEVSGRLESRVVAFARSHDSDWAITVVPRCVASLGAPVADGDRRRFWNDSAVLLPDNAPQKWTNVLAGAKSATISRSDQRLGLGDVFAEFPVAILVPSRS